MAEKGKFKESSEAPPKDRPDELLDCIGGTGYFQVALLFIVIPLQFTASPSIAMNFQGGFMDHWCKIEEIQNFSYAQQRYIAIPCDDDTDTGYSECEKYPFNYTYITNEDYYEWDRESRIKEIEGRDNLECADEWVFDRSLYSSTLRNRFGLVCAKNWLVEMVSSAYMAGFLVGVITSGFISDWFGRRSGVLFFVLVRLFGAIFNVYAPEYVSYTISRFIYSVGINGSGLCAFVMLTEHLNSTHRSILGMFWHISFSVGYMTVPILAMFVRDDVKLQAVLTWPSVFLLAYFVCLPESARWQISKGKVTQAEKSIEFIADCNNRHCSKEAIEKAFTSATDRQAEATEKPSAGFADLFRTPNMRKKTLVIYLTWFTCSLVYYGLSLNAGRLSDNVYLNVFLFGAVEIPANLLDIVLLKFIGRRLTVGGACTIAGFSSFACVAIILAGASDDVLSAFAVLGKACITATFSGIYIYSAELYPTSVRNIGIGSSSMMARVSGIMAPFIGGPLENVWKPLPSLIFGMFGTVTGCLILLLLPETLNRNLPETVEDAEAFGKTSAEDQGQILSITEVMSNGTTASNGAPKSLVNGKMEFVNDAFDNSITSDPDKTPVIETRL